MTPDKQITKIAETLGWIGVRREQTDLWDCGMRGVNPDEPDLWDMAPVPDYLNDLNAMHEAEKTLTRPQFEEYIRTLSIMTTDGISNPQNETVVATAKQRAEAFLRALGKWKEES